jgi:hypothetical protein
MKYEKGKELHDKLERLATRILVGGLSSQEFEKEWKFKPGHGWESMRLACKKGLRKGAGKLENEIYGMAKELYKVIRPKEDGE